MATPQSLDISAFAARQIALLEHELAAELATTTQQVSIYAPTTLQRAGLAVLNLSVNNQRTGFGGKTLLELGLDPAVASSGDNGELLLPQHGLRVGDICSVAEQPRGAERKKEREGMEKRGLEGVVTKVQRTALTVALDKDEADVPNGKLWLVKLANDVTYKRLNQTMNRLQKMQAAEHSILTQVLFGQASVSPVASSDLDADLKWFDDTLNPSQKDAIRFALASREVALIHGPPGTGKTHTLIELILQLHARGKRLLVCGPSNISVDNLVERLAAAQHRYTAKPPSILRLGHPARLLPSVLRHSLEVLTRTSDAAAIVADIRSDLDAKQASIRKTRSGRERKAIYTEMRELRQEFRAREGRVVGDLMRTSDVVLATLHGAGGFQVKDQRFDVVLVDEASQALEAQCWVPILGSGASKVVLAGDHLQLPPTIKSLNEKAPKTQKVESKSSDKKADGAKSLKAMEDLALDDKGKAEKSKGNKSKEGPLSLETTLFDRILALHGNDIKRMLTTQYRMHEAIMAYPSAALYEDKLIAADAVKKRLLKDIPIAIKDTEDTREPLVFWDTQGGDFPETLENDDENDEQGGSTGRKTGGLLADSKINENEAALVSLHVSRLVAAGLPAEDIAVITPYNGQRALLAQSLPERFPGIEIGSVDGFQGREKEAVVVSLVRSNEDGEVGFLGEKRRLNVAMTRPKRHLCIVGDSETISKGSKFLKAWMQHLEEHADLRYPDVADLASQA